MKNKKAYSMIELIMAVGSLLLVLGVFSVIVKTYLNEFSEGTLGERKWADVQTVFTYVNRDLDSFSKGLKSGGVLEISQSEEVPIKIYNALKTPGTIKYTVVDGNVVRNINGNESVILRSNKNFKVSGIELRVYEKDLGNKIEDNDYTYLPYTDDSVEISYDGDANYYLESVITIENEEKKITTGYALRFDDETEYKYTYTEQDLENKTITIDTASYIGQTKNVVLTAEASTGNLNKLVSVAYNGSVKATSGTSETATYDFGENVLETDMKFEFTMANSGLTTKEIRITVTISEP